MRWGNGAPLRFSDLMPRKRIYRDYRPGHEGEFLSEEDFKRFGGVSGEYIDAPDENTITNIEQLFEMSEDEDYEDFDEYEFHGTGDTGRRE